MHKGRARYVKPRASAVRQSDHGENGRRQGLLEIMCNNHRHFM
jgi:hypothetical protein